MKSLSQVLAEALLAVVQVFFPQLELQQSKLVEVAMVFEVALDLALGKV